MLATIEGARLCAAAARMATDTFRLLADAEAVVHGVAPERVHFHEVGAADALVRCSALAGGDLAGERTTPTGAALVAILARPGPLPPMTINAVGSGAGARDSPERPNITRLLYRVGLSGRPGSCAAGHRGGDHGR